MKSFLFYLKNIPTTTTPKYHVYFSPKNPVNSHIGSNKIKPKRKGNEETKDEHENETTNQHDVSSSSTEQTKTHSSSSTAPMTRRSINTRSVPNTAAEQEEEKLRRFVLLIQFDFSLQFDFLLDSQQCFQKILIVGNHNQWQLFNFLSHKGIFF
jgi:hypothetical protein